VLEAMVSEWDMFKRALRKEDRRAFEMLMAKARKHANAAGYDARVNPMESFFMAIILEMEKELTRLKERFDQHGKMDH
jgi:hypothetical protein